PKSAISSDWKTANAIVPNGEKIVVFADNVWEVNPDGKYKQLKTSDYSVFKWTEVGTGWEKAEAIFAYNDRIYVVLDAIWEIRLDSTYKKVQNEDWSTNNWNYKLLSSGWKNSFLLLALDNKLFVYDIILTILDTNTGGKTPVYDDNWNKILAGGATSSAMHTVYDSGNLWKVSKP
ncbi:15033_t:CDS:2, partial [Cetraspora pellucida]